MIKFYYNTAPNPTKVALCLEEMGLPYQPVPVDTRKGEQHASTFLAINPNAKVPAIVDGEATVFDSSAILFYLAEKTGQFLPAHSPSSRASLYSWMMFVATGVGPYSGQAVHFTRYAPEPLPYAINRYAFEARRHYAILDARLAGHRYIEKELAIQLACSGDQTRLDPRLECMTPREFEIFVMLAKGPAPRQVAHHLCLSSKTISNNLTCKRRINKTIKAFH